MTEQRESFFGENNRVFVAGAIEDAPVLSHEVFGEKFYIFTLRVMRLSDICDFVKVIISERLFSAAYELVPDVVVAVTGQFRSYNNYACEGNRLVLTVFAKSVMPADSEMLKNPNSIMLNGFICKPPVFRVTPFGREITDLLLAVNRSYNKSDYIPIIAWGRNARFCRDLTVGTNIRVCGRIQSREYQKRIDENSVETKTAYEISVGNLELPEDEE